MQGFTPWELSTFKLVYHRFDNEKKGFLDADDVAQLCAALGVHLTSEELTTLYNAVDVDGDQHVNFDELLYFLSHAKQFNDVVGCMKLRAEIMNSNASFAAGAAMGLIPLLKGKMLVGLGTMFYDPIRLYRDVYVEYCTAIRGQVQSSATMKSHKSVTDAAKLQGMTASQLIRQLGIGDVFRVHLRAGGSILLTVGLVLYAFCLDCTLGVLMFTAYSKARRHLVDKAASEEWWKQPSDVVGFNWSQLQGTPAGLEFVAGSFAGALMGLFQSPVKYCAKHTKWFLPSNWKNFQRKEFFVHTRSNLLRQGLSHGVFFAAFSESQQQLRHYLNQHGYERTSWREALTVSASGCAAGGMYRVVSHPSAKLLDFRAKHNGSLKPFFEMTARNQIRQLTAGLGESLLFTMPVTGIAFLIYEAAFLL